MAKLLRHPATPWLVAALCLIPIGHLVFRFFTYDLGVNPIETLIHELGVWGLRFIVGGLAITPLARLLKQPVLFRLRRPIGLVAFAYVLLHWCTYIGVDQFFDWTAIWKDLVKRPYITFGMAAFVILLPLAITSTNAMLKRVGPRTWRRLHQFIYAAAIFGVVHYFLLLKADKTDALIYGGILALLLGWRLVMFARSQKWLAPRKPKEA